VSPGWIALDVGAHIGYYALLLARLVGENGHVFALEPARAAYDALLRNLSLNPYSNVTPLQVGLGDHCRSAALGYPDPNHPSQAHVVTTSAQATETVTLTTLDRFALDYCIPRLDFVKVDIEGYESAFLAGAHETLSRFRPILMVEVNHRALARFGATATSFLRTLRLLRYRLFVPTHFGRLRLHKSHNATLSYYNLFCLPEEEAFVK
jgi:FkbM family methyltransferase